MVRRPQHYNTCYHVVEDSVPEAKHARTAVRTPQSPPNGTLPAYARALARQHILYATEPGNLWRVNQGTIVLVITWSKTQFLKRNMRAGAWTPWQKK